MRICVNEHILLYNKVKLCQYQVTFSFFFLSCSSHSIHSSTPTHKKHFITSKCEYVKPMSALWLDVYMFVLFCCLYNFFGCLCGKGVECTANIHC